MNQYYEIELIYNLDSKYLLLNSWLGINSIVIH